MQGPRPPTGQHSGAPGKPPPGKSAGTPTGGGRPNTGVHATSGQLSPSGGLVGPDPPARMLPGWGQPELDSRQASPAEGNHPRCGSREAHRQGPRETCPEASQASQSCSQTGSTRGSHPMGAEQWWAAALAKAQARREPQPPVSQCVRRCGEPVVQQQAQQVGRRTTKPGRQQSKPLSASTGQELCGQ